MGRYDFKNTPYDYTFELQSAPQDVPGGTFDTSHEIGLDSVTERIDYMGDVDYYILSNSI